jgi:hypothetical protein
LTEAVRELQFKMLEWNPMVMGSIPFLLCVATGANFVQFAVMGPDRVFHFGERLNVLEVPHKLLFVRTVVNCFRIIRANLQFAPPAGSFGLYQRITREHSGCTIEFWESSVVKTFTLKRSADESCSFSPSRLKDLTMIFAALAERKPKFCEYPTKAPNIRARRNSLTVEMVPLGCKVFPADEQELRKALRCVLQGLRELHVLGWLHEDVRWPNVLRKANGDWFLIDYDCAVKIAGSGPSKDLACAGHKLFEAGTPIRFSPGALAFGDFLKTATTVEAALEHPWINAA